MRLPRSLTYGRLLALAAPLALVGMACVTLTGQVSTRPPETTTSASSPARLVLVGADRNIYLLDPATGQRTAVTQDAVVQPAGESIAYSGPVVAPRSGRLAFIRTVVRSDGGHQSDLLVSSGDPDDTQTVFSDASRAPFYLYWSPDGQVLSFLASNGPSSLEVYLARPGESAQVLDQGQPYYWAWAPDGESLLAHVGGAAEDNPAGARLSWFEGEPLQIQNLELSPGLFQAPDISPDGRQLLVAGTSANGQPELQLTDRSGQSPTRLVSLTGPVGFAWSPVGSTVAYVSLPGTGGEAFGTLNWLDVSRPDQPQPTPGAIENVVAFFWSPTGEQLAYFVPELAAPGSQQQASFSRRAQELVLHLNVVSLDGSDPVQLATFVPTNYFLAILPYFDQYQRSNTIWSPDGEQVVYTDGEANGAPGVYVVGRSGQTSPKKVADGSLAFWSWP